MLSTPQHKTSVSLIQQVQRIRKKGQKRGLRWFLKLGNITQERFDTLSSEELQMLVQDIVMRVMDARAQRDIKKIKQLQSANAELSEDHQKLEEAIKLLRHLLAHDYLTGLPTRKALDQYIKDTITSLDTEAVFMIFDLRKFKDLNDKYGHEIGDHVLRFTADVCRKLTKLYNGSVIARKGGDEFTGVFPGCSTASDTEQIGADFLRIWGEQWGNRPLELQVINEPIGVAMGLVSLQDTGEIRSQIPSKNGEPRTELEEKVAKSLYKADKMAEAAKDIENGLLCSWNILYDAEKTLSPENKKLRMSIESIVRHWISDESIPGLAKELRKLLISQSDPSHIGDDIRTLSLHIRELCEKGKLNPEQLNLIQVQLNGLSNEILSLLISSRNPVS